MRTGTRLPTWKTTSARADILASLFTGVVLFMASCSTAERPVESASLASAARAEPSEAEQVGSSTSNSGEQPVAQTSAPTQSPSPTATAPPVTLQPGDLDLNAAHLPRNYAGIPFDKLFARLKHAPKSEFETEQQFRDRLALDPHVYYATAFRNGADTSLVELKYAAEIQSFTAKLFPEPPTGTGSFDLNQMCFQLDRTRAAIGSYVGENAFGVRRNVEKVVIDRPSVCTGTASLIGYNGVDVPVSIPIPANQAPNIKPNLRFFLVFAPAVGPFGRQETGHSSLDPTIDSPVAGDMRYRYIWASEIQFWCVNGKTGDIYAKVPIARASKQ